MDIKLIYRLHQIGVAQERLSVFLENYSELFYEVESKHSLDTFCTKYKQEEHLEDLFYKLRGMKERLMEINYMLFPETGDSI